jgi:hypothetical protein
MTDGKRKWLRTAGRAILLVSIAVQIFIIAKEWWAFDPRQSCERLPYWGEWIACLHGHSHAYIRNAEAAVVVWLIAGIAMLLGLFLPPYISAVVPGLAIVVFVLSMIRYWHLAVLPLGPFGQPRSEDVVFFVSWLPVTAAFFVGPIVGAWLAALDARTGRTQLRVPI